jgi:hypothetical protein
LSCRCVDHRSAMLTMRPDPLCVMDVTGALVTTKVVSRLREMAAHHWSSEVYSAGAPRSLPVAAVIPALLINTSLRPHRSIAVSSRRRACDESRMSPMNPMRRCWIGLAYGAPRSPARQERAPVTR